MALLPDASSLDVLPVAAFVCDADGRITACNSRAVALWGQRPSPGEPADHFCEAVRLRRLDGAAIPAQEGPTALVLRTGEAVRNFEAVIERPDGSRVTVLAHASPVRGPGGELLGVVQCFEDAGTITVRTQELAAILDSVPAIVWIAHDPQGRHITGSRAAAEFLRMAPGENMSKTGADAPSHFRVLDAGGRELAGESLPVQAAARGREVRGFDEKVVFDDGTVRQIFGNSVPLRGADGAVRGSVAAFIDVTERKQAADDLDDFFENAAVGCHWVGPTGTILRANRAVLDLLGYERNEYVGRSITDFHVDPAVIDDLLARLVRNEIVREYPARLRAKDGSIREVLVDSSALWRDGRFVHSRCFLRDVTELAGAREAQARLAAIVESSDDAIVAKTLQGVVTSWNRGAQRLFGYTAEEAVGRPITFVIPESRLAEERDILSRIARGERVEHFETVRVTKDGRPIDISITVSPVRDERGRIIGASKIAREIGQQRRAERERHELLEREREARQVAETLNQVGRALAGELDLERVVQIVTDAATRLSGAQFGAFFYNVTNASGESYTLYTISGVPKEAFSRYPLPRNTPLFGPTFRGEATVRLDDVRKDPRFGKVPPHHGLPEGHLPVVSYLAVPVISRTKEVLGGLFLGHGEAGVFEEHHEAIVEGLAAQAAIAVDNARLYSRAQDELNRRREAEEETRALNAVLETRVRERTRSLEEMVRELDTFAYTVAHDLRAPLRAVHSFGQMLSEEAGPKLNDQERTYLEHIIRAGARMDQLIRDLLAYSRVSRDQFELEVVDLETLVRNAIAQVKEEEQGAQADLALEGDLPVALGHGITLSQAVLNLLRNAVKFVPPGTTPRVRVRAEDRDTSVRIWVEDNGIGIAPQYFPKLFRIFERLHGSNAYPGTGVGLAIVRRGVERMGGKVGVESEPGKGSRFFIELRKPPHGGKLAPGLRPPRKAG